MGSWLACDLSGQGLRFERPGALLLLLAIPLVAWRAIHREPRVTVTMASSRGADLDAVAGAQGFWARVRGLPSSLRMVALALVVLALGRPQTHVPAGHVELEGIDVMLVLDLSNSMSETDLVPDRLGAAKRVIDDFIARRRNDRIGLVVFGREAFSYCPLTLDYSTLRSLLDGVTLGLVDGRGTAVGNALGSALARLRRSDAQTKVVVLLTDGDSNSGNISPREAARLARDLKVRVFTVLMGKEAKPEGDPGAFGPRSGSVYGIDPRLLEEIAAKTGGTPYRATDTRALEDRFHAILEELDRSELRDVGALYGEVYPRFLWPALAMCLVDVILRLTRLRSFP